MGFTILNPQNPCANLAKKGYERTREHFGEALKIHDIEGVGDFLNCGMTPETPPFISKPAGCWYAASSKENKEKENELIDLLIEHGWNVNFDCSFPPPYKYNSD